MHWIPRGAAKQEAKPSPATNSREDSTFGGLPTVGSVHISCNERGLCLPFELKMTIAAFFFWGGGGGVVGSCACSPFCCWVSTIYNSEQSCHC